MCEVVFGLKPTVRLVASTVAWALARAGVLLRTCKRWWFFWGGRAGMLGLRLGLGGARAEAHGTVGLTTVAWALARAGTSRHP